MSNILLVEDSIDNQTLIKRRLSSRGFNVITADDGEQGFNLALQENPDIVLMDLDLPILNGWDATQKLRDRNFKSPIIALTAHAMEEHRTRAFNAGCDEFLTKPIDFELLVKTIQQFTNKE